ncbi:MAG: hypothetical protein ACREQH_05575 [Candidatus Binatus sp.]
MEMSTYAAHDDLPTLFQGAGLLPVQFAESRRKKLPSEAERKLLFAVLEDAVRCYLKHRDGGQAERNHPDFVEAALWLSSDQKDSPFAFVSVCDGLGIDADRLRLGINNHTGRLAEIRT